MMNVSDLMAYTRKATYLYIDLENTKMDVEAPVGNIHMAYGSYLHIYIGQVITGCGVPVCPVGVDVCI
jgi:hypothetical protein